MRSFNPKHMQLWYLVVLRPEENVLSCSCKAFQFRPDWACKHILKVIAEEVQGMIVDGNSDSEEEI